MAIGCSIGIVMIGVSSLMKNFWIFFALYGSGFGICNGIAYIVPIYNSWRYFPNNKGLVGGIVVAGFGFGAFVFNFVASAIVNPNHVEADPNGYFPIDVADNVPKMIRVLTLCWFTISILGILLIFPYQDDNNKERLG
jgi:MFS transporter, OFA family, oxalate/formate antiporter